MRRKIYFISKNPSNQEMNIVLGYQEAEMYTRNNVSQIMGDERYDKKYWGNAEICSFNYKDSKTYNISYCNVSFHTKERNNF